MSRNVKEHEQINLHIRKDVFWGILRFIIIVPLFICAIYSMCNTDVVETTYTTKEGLIVCKDCDWAQVKWYHVSSLVVLFINIIIWITFAIMAITWTTPKDWR